ncbi:hypothetical protein SF123566_9139 [Shigella flexneri 1235-66]|nr:hypothetical protein SF123566_9139 [Shigella flexneri 1235-66]
MSLMRLLLVMTGLYRSVRRIDCAVSGQILGAFVMYLNIY